MQLDFNVLEQAKTLADDAYTLLTNEDFNTTQ